MDGKRWRALLGGLAVVAGVVSLGPPAAANHPVLVEGTCLGPAAAQKTVVVPGTCGDYDGDGRIGSMEDGDEADRVFGTINAALGNTDLGAAINATRANQNGRVLIVASGVFPETVVITAAMGNVTLEAAAGVDADIDAVLQGDGGNAARQGAPGVVVDSPATRVVTIRNLMSRNWTVGYRVQGASRVILDRVRAENNRDYGIQVSDSARVTISGSHVDASGFRQGAGVDNTPQPGIGIEFEGQARGSIFFSTVSSSFDAGLSIDLSKKEMKSHRRRWARSTVTRDHLQLFDNNPDLRLY